MTEESIISENEKMNKLAQEYANLLAEESEIPEPDLRSEIEKARDEETVFNTKTKLSDIHGNEVTVPAGFKIAKDTGLTVQQGVVIEDVNASTDTAVQGSQFVWIPVGKFIKDDGTESNEIILGRYTFDETNGTLHLEQAAYTNDNPTNYENEVSILDTEGNEHIEISEYRQGLVSDGLDGENATAYELGKWVDSARINGGYYIGKYEASYASGATNEDTVGDYSKCKAASKVSETYSDSSMQYNTGTLWNFITQINASKVAINTYKDSSSVKSDLMNSYAWDTAIVYIQEAGNDNYANLPTDGKFINTGLGTDEVCKINDLAFNCSEWITEYSDKELGMMPNRHNYPTVWRGEYYTAFRVIGYMTTDGAVRNISFRLCLYM